MKIILRKCGEYMRKTGIASFILIFSLFLLTVFLPVTTAGGCDYGSLYAWFRKDGNEWQNATVHPTLKLGEEFEIKVTATAKKDLAGMSLQIDEFGTPVFEVVDGPSVVGEWIDWINLKTNDTFTYIWKIRVRTNTTWVEGYAPLEVFSQFDKEYDQNCKVSFDVITAYILDELWDGYTEDNGNSNDSGNGTNGTPGFEFLAILIASVLVLVWKRKDRH